MFRINNVILILLSVSIILSIMGDSILQNTILGTAGMNLAIFSSPFLLFFIIIKWAYFHFKKFLAFIFLSLFSFFLSLIWNIAHEISFDLLLFFKLLLMYSILIAFIFSPYPKKMHKYFFFAFIVTFFTVFFADISESMAIHGSPNGNMRPRGLYFESSHYATALYSFGLISSYYFSKIKRYIVIFLTLVGVFYSQSKGAVGVIIITFGVTFLLNFFYLRYNDLKKEVLLVLLFLLIAGILTPYFISIISLSLDSELSTSITTRFSGFIAGIYATVYFPFGSGLSSYGHVLPILLERSTEFINSNFTFNLNFSEVNEYIYNEDGKGLSAKSFLSNILIIFGVPGVVLLIILIKNTLKRLIIRDELFLIFNFLMGVISLSTFSDGLNMYPIFMLIGVSVYHAYRKIN